MDVGKRKLLQNYLIHLDNPIEFQPYTSISGFNKNLIPY